MSTALVTLAGVALNHDPVYRAARQVAQRLPHQVSGEERP